MLSPKKLKPTRPGTACLRKKLGILMEGIIPMNDLKQNEGFQIKKIKVHKYKRANKRF